MQPPVASTPSRLGQVQPASRLTFQTARPNRLRQKNCGYGSDVRRRASKGLREPTGLWGWDRWVDATNAPDYTKSRGRPLSDGPHQPVTRDFYMYGVLLPVGGGDPIPLLKKGLLVGRREARIALRFSNVSAHHCQLTVHGGYWHVRDLKSRNGVRLTAARYGEADRSGRCPFSGQTSATR